MNITTVIIGGKKDDRYSTQWESTVDEYGNSFFKNDSIRQKIRVGKSITPVLDGEKEITERKYRESVYTSNSGTFVSNNYKNMHLVLMNYHSKNKNETAIKLIHRINIM